MIGINAKPALQHPQTGLEEYAYQLITHLIREARKRGLEKYLLLYAPSWAGIPEEFLQVPLKVVKSSRLWTQGRLALELFFSPPSLFFNPEQILPRFAPERSVITVHDLAYEMYPHLYPAWHRRYLHIVTKRAIRKAKKIIAVSDRTKRDIAKFYGVPQRNIEVIYHGFSLPQDVLIKEVKSEINAFSLPTREPFFLYVGRIELKKNIMRLIDAFEIACQKLNNSFSLVLAGPPGFGFNRIKKRIRASRAKKQIFLLGYIDSAIKHELYQHAFAFILVSLYEGFGLPILEAQSFGVPVIASGTSSLPEVLGQSALFANPQEPEEIAEKMYDIVKQPKMRRYLIKKGYENLTRFSWEKCAKETLDVLLNL
ncbi:MAG: glycosyltransferase family 4 protein [Candidatus Portnoybacteria bacterium]|nr:glycosyltransferase family 4 protein [Candidatus Portnoybacteria bacterium]